MSTEFLSEEDPILISSDHHSSVVDLDVNQSLLVSVDQTGNLFLRRPETFTLFRKMILPEDSVTSLTVHPVGPEMFLVKDHLLFRLSLEGEMRPLFPEVRPRLAFWTEPSRLFWNLDGSSARHPLFQLGDLEKEEILHSFVGHSHYVSTFALSGTTLATGSFDRTIRLWDLRTYQSSAPLKAQRNLIDDVDLDDQYLVSSSLEKKVVIWDRRKLEDPLHTLPGWGTLALHGGDLFTTSWDRLVRRWSLTDLSEPETIYRHFDQVTTFKIDTRNLITGSRDRRIRAFPLEGEV